jgi:hypothetical protein
MLVKYRTSVLISIHVKGLKMSQIVWCNPSIPISRDVVMLWYTSYIRKCHSNLNFYKRRAHISLKGTYCCEKLNWVVCWFSHVTLNSLSASFCGKPLRQIRTATIAHSYWFIKSTLWETITNIENMLWNEKLTKHLMFFQFILLSKAM